MIVQAVLAEHPEHIGQERDAGAEQDQANDVERVRIFLAVVGQILPHQIEAEEALTGKLTKKTMLQCR